MDSNQPDVNVNKDEIIILLTLVGFTKRNDCNIYDLGPSLYCCFRLDEANVVIIDKTKLDGSRYSTLSLDEMKTYLLNLTK